MKTRKTPFAMFTPCTKCGEAEPAQFYAGGGSYCKRCHKDAVLRSRLAKKGLTPEEEAAMAERQGFKCSICKGAQQGSLRSLHMDHCHATGKARGMLCLRCNQTLGRVKDDPAILQAMLDYLNKYK